MIFMFLTRPLRPEVDGVYCYMPRSSMPTRCAMVDQSQQDRDCTDCTEWNCSSCVKKICSFTIRIIGHYCMFFSDFGDKAASQDNGGRLRCMPQSSWNSMKCFCESLVSNLFRAVTFGNSWPFILSMKLWLSFVRHVWCSEWTIAVFSLARTNSCKVSYGFMLSCQRYHLHYTERYAECGWKACDMQI